METDTTETKANGARKSAPGRPLLVYSPRPDATPEAETEVLASVYRYILQRHERREAAGKVGGDENVPEVGHAGEQLKEGHA
jgi:hypothetical protein